MASSNAKYCIKLCVFLLAGYQMATCFRSPARQQYHRRSVPRIIIYRNFQSISSDNDSNNDVFFSDKTKSNNGNNTYYFQKTGIQKEINWEYEMPPVPLDSEIKLLKSGVLVKRGEFCKLYDERLEEIEAACQRFGMTVHQGLIIRRQLMVGKVMDSSWKLKNEQIFLSIKSTFENQQQALLDMAVDFDLPPVSIIRAIIADRVDKSYPYLRHGDRKRIVKSIISEESSVYAQEFLANWELQELQQAKQFDVVGFSEEGDTPILWEDALYTYLSQQGINYVTENALREVDMKYTPDCLILDDLRIDGHLVRWIDAKSFYASGLRENKHFKLSLKKQIHRYETEFGESGAVIYRHGFSRKLRKENPSTLFLDGGPLNIESC